MKKDQSMGKPKKIDLLMMIRKLYVRCIVSEALKEPDEGVEMALKAYNLHKYSEEIAELMKK